MFRKTVASSLLAAAMSFGVAHAASYTINAGGSSLAGPTYFEEFDLYHSTVPTIKFSYAAVGSGKGQNGFLNNDITQYQNPPAGTLTYGKIVGSTVHFGASDATLSASQFTNPATGSYAKSSTDGPLIQLPTFGTPITIPYNQTKIAVPNQTLTDDQLCGIFSGKINDWHKIVGYVPAGTTIQVTYRHDGSGTTFLLTQHLHAVCNATNSSFSTLPVAITTSFATLFPSSTPPANFTGEDGSANVANHMLTTPNSIGYVSPDYTSIAPNSPSTTSLKVAKLLNPNDGIAYLPTVSATIKGLANAGPGSANAVPPQTKADAMNPMNWIPTIPVTLAGYPIVGYTTMDVSSCYSNVFIGTHLNQFLKLHYTNIDYKNIIKSSGFAPLVNTAAVPYVAAIINTFLGNASGYNLNIDNATLCASYPGR